MVQLSKEQAQKHYNSLIELSNLAFNSSGNPDIPGMLRSKWSAKAETYYAVAAMFYNLCSLAGVFLEHSKTDYETFIEQERRDSCQEDAELDEIEMIYHEEID